MNNVIDAPPSAESLKVGGDATKAAEYAAEQQDPDQNAEPGYSVDAAGTFEG